ncbi:unnamed protein product [Anisakis simplex]|uniref:Uncharacterized protein n=1 Tax=Anisakis simplex TaxID=6269 RepID=A0A0M3JU18_ANISI|nr:unnamed protein product [Anisakis simplex]
MLWPMAQCALSTILAMSPILLQPSYISFVFSNTIFFVVVFSAFHGTIVLPVTLIALNIGGTYEAKRRHSNVLSSFGSRVTIVPITSLTSLDTFKTKLDAY